MKFADHIKARIQNTLGCLPMRDLTVREALLNNLIFSQQTMRASEDLLKVGAARSRGKLKQYYRSHLNEERGHAQWLAEDLLTAGVDVKAVPLRREAAEMVGVQYYLTQYVDSHALLGYMAVHECFPKSPELVGALEHLYGKELLRTVRHHAVHDVDHGRDLEAMLNAVPAVSQSIVEGSALQSALYFGAAAKSF